MFIIDRKNNLEKNNIITVLVQKYEIFVFAYISLRLLNTYKGQIHIHGRQ